MEQILMDSPGASHEPQISPARLLRRSHLLGDFLTVIAEGSIRQAADKIAISQSALTRRIQDLEEGLGASLFERTSRGMTLTPFGEVLKHHAQLVAITCQYAVSEISELLEGEAGELRISAGPAWAYALVPDAIAAMQATRPKIRVTLLDLINDVSLPMLASGLLDVVLGGLPPTRDPQLEYEPILEIEHLVFANEQHPLNQLPVVTATQLTAYPWIWFTTGAASPDLMVSYFQQAALAPPAAMVETSSAQSAFRLMQQSNYLMLLPSTSLGTAAHHSLRPLPLQRSFGHYIAGMMYRPSVRRLKAFTSFRDALLGELASRTV
jgi:LysR family transcriptional regulator of abg operon